MTYWRLFFAFFRSGMLGYGGGLSAIPLMHREVVENFKWMKDEEFSDILALANTLPGPINTKMSGYIGWRIKGLGGLLCALAGTVLPTAILMIIFLTVLTAYKDQGWVKGMSKAVVPIAGVMLASLTWDFVKKAKISMGWKITFLLLGISIIILEVLHLHPAILIAVILVAALFTPSKGKRKEQSS